MRARGHAPVSSAAMVMAASLLAANMKTSTFMRSADCRRPSACTPVCNMRVSVCA